MEKLAFPAGFLLGAASSAHQVEGNNNKNDWWHFEQEGKLPKSGNAADHYNRFEEDFTIAKQIGLNALRISIEWARVEPEEGKWYMEAVEHYRKVLKAIKSRGMQTMVTLHHFTLPLWFANQGGFLNKEAPNKFARFAGFVAGELGEDIDLVCTINEPQIYWVMGYRYGLWPPFRKLGILSWQYVVNKLANSHVAAYATIKKENPTLQVGLVENLSFYESKHKWSPLEALVLHSLRYSNNHFLISKIQHSIDFFGLNYYFSHPLDMFNLRTSLDIKVEQGPRSDMRWRIYPKGLYHLLLSLGKYSKPIYITENGLADKYDKKRYNFIYDHLAAVKQAMSEGVDVRGYFYWSLTDTYEWHDGYSPKFGLVEVDFETQKRTIRESSRIFKEIRA